MHFAYDNQQSDWCFFQTLNHIFNSFHYIVKETIYLTFIYIHIHILLLHTFMWYYINRSTN